MESYNEKEPEIDISRNLQAKIFERTGIFEQMLGDSTFDFNPYQLENKDMQNVRANSENLVSCLYCMHVIKNSGS